MSSKWPLILIIIKVMDVSRRVYLELVGFMSMKQIWFKLIVMVVVWIDNLGRHGVINLLE